MRPERVPTELLRHPVAKYYDYDPYWGDEEQAVMRKIELVRPRTDSDCLMGARAGGNCKHPAGSVMWQESGLIEGSFCKNNLCLPHVAIGIEFEKSGDRDPCEFTCEQAAAYRPEPEDEATP